MPGSLRRGVRLGKYRLEKQLGKGGYATVWAARDTIEDRRVALKVTDKQSLDEQGRKGIEREARIAASLSHPNIVSVRNANWIGDRFVLAFDLARTTLHDYAGAKRSANVALRVIRDVVAGLAYAHERKLMHRDVKPENVLIFPDGRAALTDFGVSLFTRGETITLTEVGTLGYMAPEQAYGRPNLASDVFSVGVIAYDLLGGWLLNWPFEWPPQNYEKFKSRVPEPLRPVIRKACEFNPRRRYRSAVEMHEAFEAAWRKIEAKKAPRTRRRRKVAKPPQSPLAVQAELFRKHHGRRLGMKYSCHKCDGPIAESMSHCPWCGNADNSFREVSSAPLVCPSCERGVLPEWTACPWCYSGRFEGNGRPPRLDRSAERNCATKGCPGQLRPFMRYCPQCKKKPGRPWTDPELRDRCKRCRWPVSREFWRFCAWCGRKQNGH